MTEAELRAVISGIAPIVRELQQRVTIAEVAVGQLADATREIATLRERVAVLERRELVPAVVDTAPRLALDDVGETVN